MRYLSSVAATLFALVAFSVPVPASAPFDPITYETSQHNYTMRVSSYIDADGHIQNLFTMWDDADTPEEKDRKRKAHDKALIALLRQHPETGSPATRNKPPHPDGDLTNPGITYDRETMDIIVRSSVGNVR